jgi:hypothetical protein
LKDGKGAEVATAAAPVDASAGVIKDTGENRFMALEQKRYEECPAALGPGNDVVVASVLIVWSATAIAVKKNTGARDWQQAYIGTQVEGLFKSIPEGSTVEMITESSDVTLGFNHCCEQHRRELQPEQYMCMPQWIGMMRTMMQRNIDFKVRTFDEENDMGPIKMRMLWIWEAQDTKERGVSERSNPSTCLA